MVRNSDSRSEYNLISFEAEPDTDVRRLVYTKIETNNIFLEESIRSLQLIPLESPVTGGTIDRYVVVLQTSLSTVRSF